MVNKDIQKKMENYFVNSKDSVFDKLSNFPKYVLRQDISRFLAKYEIYKKILDVDGSIIECGIKYGGGLMTFAHLSSIFEPVNYTRKIIGFDTFAGFPNLSKEDKGSKSKFAKKGGFKADSYNDLKKSISLFDSNRFLGEIPKVEMVKGDATQTIPKYIKENQHLVVGLLYLDFDIYEPTKVALENFLPRMPKGSIIVFDEINNPHFVGETKAVLDTIGFSNLRIKRFDFNTFMSYAILD
jgi:hypothetical protein